MKIYLEDILILDILLCDIMTNKGVLTPINRQGIKVGDTGPLGKC